jgi:hypothetical protein
MQLIRPLFFCLVALLSGAVSFAQTNNDCKSLLTAAIKKMKTSHGTGYKLEYQVVTKYQGENALEEYVSNAQVIVSGEKSFFKNDELSIYKDEHNSVTIKRGEKEIYLANAITTDWNKVRAESFSILNDSLLTKFQVVSCETSCPANKKESYIDQITVTLPKEYRSFMGFDEITYWINRNKQQIVRCNVHYTNHVYGITSVDMKINQYDSDYRGSVYDGEALSKVFGTNEELLPVFNKYSIKDLR